MTDLDPRLLHLSEKDNIAVLAASVQTGEMLRVGGIEIAMLTSLGLGHKIAVRSIAEGEDVLKYGLPIGFANCDIVPGDHVHVHNLTSRYTVVEVVD